MKRSPMKTSSKPISRGKPMKARIKKRPTVDGIDYLTLCRGQKCYLQMDWTCSPLETVVPCHSNQLIHGKCMGKKADDEYTVPGCMRCHAELDQGKRFTKDQKKGFWNSAHERWKIDRSEILKGVENE